MGLNADWYPEPLIHDALPGVSERSGFIFSLNRNLKCVPGILTGNTALYKAVNAT